MTIIFTIIICFIGSLFFSCLTPVNLFVVFDSSLFVLVLIIIVFIISYLLTYDFISSGIFTLTVIAIFGVIIFIHPEPENPPEKVFIGEQCLTLPPID